jgi:hypothetical protein
VGLKRGEAKNPKVSSAEAQRRRTTMSVQKKSLINSRPTEKKASTKPVKETSIGESKSLTANALRPPTAFRSLKKASRRIDSFKMVDLKR